MGAPELLSQHWYEAPENIERRFCGVFEGGGAKGIAYIGALQAMAQEKCWFSAVAGASAGAITAALVASGLSPAEMEDATDEAFTLVRTGVWTGLRRLRSATGYLPSNGLRDWLNELMAAQVSKRGVAPSAAITFEELYACTDIELNVVAADLSERAQFVFSHIETPRCVVADAVVASSSIPLAFASRLLEFNDGEGLSHHTIVDGGVWSNFPMHIFEDQAFRRSYRRTPEKIEPGRVLGFVLQSEQDDPPRGGHLKFVQSAPSKEFRAREWTSDEGPDANAASTAGAKIGAAALYPFSLLGRLVNWNSGVDRGRWPTPRAPVARRLVQSIDGLLGGAYPPLFGLLGVAVVATGAWAIIKAFGTDQINALRATNWSQFLSYPSRALSLILTLLVIAIAVLMVFVCILGVVANCVLLRAVRRIMYGVVTTYVAGPGAPRWVASKPNVILLPIPPCLTTLSFDISPETRRESIAAAKQATLTWLHKPLTSQI